MRNKVRFAMSYTAAQTMVMERPSTVASPCPSVSVVVPVYNSEQTLEALVDRLQPVLDRLASDYEVILVNDGSADKSWEKTCELARTRPWVRGINLMRNYGQHNA